MNRICWQLVDLVCRGLDPAEREVVRGDLAESGESGGQALRGVLGLVMRRQLALWKNYRPWVAVIALCGFGVWFLNQFAGQIARSLADQSITYSHFGVHYGTGVPFRLDAFALLCLCLAMFAWSWTAGCALGSMSGRTIWLTAALFYAATLNSVAREIGTLAGVRQALGSPGTPFLEVVLQFAISVQLLLLFLPSSWGMRRGLRGLQFRQTVVMFAAVAILTLLVAWTRGWYETARQVWSGGRLHPMPQHVMLAPLLLLSWPAAYMLVTASLRKWRTA